MINKPIWLPDVVPFSKHHAWSDYLENIFQVFKKDFIDSTLLYDNKPVYFDNKNINNYPACFWHLITEDKKSNYNRASVEGVSLLRCERICWIRPIIENHNDKEVSVWFNTRDKKTNKIFFLENYNYVVILTDVKNRFYLVTAYYINYSFRKQQLIKERDRFLEMQKPPLVGTV